MTKDSMPHDGRRLKTANHMIAGAVLMGVGMGPFEETIHDPRNTHPINDNVADFVVATSVDTPQIEVHLLDIPDLVTDGYGARGISEIGLAGVVPAIAAAASHATNVRVRELSARVEGFVTAKT